MKRFVDLSMLLEEDIPSDPPGQIPSIQRMDHKETAKQMSQFFAYVSFITYITLSAMISCQLVLYFSIMYRTIA